MAVPPASLFSFHSPYFNSLTLQLSDDSQGRYTIVGVSIPERPIPPSLPSIDPLPNIGKIDAIPEELQEDPLFQEYTDPISYEPIFDPVADKNEPKHIYERATIVQWLQSNYTSPLTRKPMTEADLVPVPELKEKINEKIRDHFLQKHPELLQKHKEEVEKANKQYEEDLGFYYEVKLPHYKSKCRDLPCQERIFFVATGFFIHLGNSLNSQPDRLQSLRGRASVIPTSSSLFSRIQKTFETTLGTLLKKASNFSFKIFH